MSKREWMRLIRIAATVLVLVIELSVVFTPATAQNPHPKDGIFAGYSVLFPNGWEELDCKSN